MSNILLSIVSGLASGLSFDIPQLSFLIWFSFIPLIYLLYKLKKPAVYFFLAGIVNYLVIFFWIGSVTSLGEFALILYLSLYWLIFAYSGKFFISYKFAIVVLPALWVVLEFIRENAAGASFGWGILGYSQFKNIFLIQISDILGVKFISFIIITVNVAIFKAYKQKKILTNNLLYVLILFVVSVGYSTYRLRTIVPSSYLKVSIVQPNIPQGLKWNMSAASYIIGKLKRLSKGTNPDTLVIYPEASWPKLLDTSARMDLSKWVKSLKKNVLIGAVIKEKDKFYNAALLIDREGQYRGVYRKIKLVPFGEYVPLRHLLRFIPVINDLGDISAGRDFHIFDYHHKKFGVLICFEDIFPGLAAKLARHSDLLVNITNDGWFDGNPEAIQHLSIMVFRAIENRISIVRAANTGISGYVDFLGHIHIVTNKGKALFVDAVAELKVPLNSARSIYNKIGDVFPFLCIFIILVFLIIYSQPKCRQICSNQKGNER